MACFATTSAFSGRLSAAAFGGVTLGSQSYGAATRTGLLQPAITTPITASGGVYTIDLPAASAVMLTQ